MIASKTIQRSKTNCASKWTRWRCGRQIRLLPWWSKCRIYRWSERLSSKKLSKKRIERLRASSRMILLDMSLQIHWRRCFKKNAPRSTKKCKISSRHSRGKKNWQLSASRNYQPNIEQSLKSKKSRTSKTSTRIKWGKRERLPLDKWKMPMLQPYLRLKKTKRRQI